MKKWFGGRLVDSLTPIGKINAKQKIISELLNLDNSAVFRKELPE